jgi:hypothetical protein
VQLRPGPAAADNTSIVAARSLLWLVGTLAVVATLWLTLLSGGHTSPTATPGATTSPSGATGDYKSAVDAAQSAVQQANQDTQRGSTAGAP